MREFSKIKTTIWKSRKVRALGDDVLTPRVLFIYLLANEHGNSCGCFDLFPLYVCADLQCSKEGFERCMEALCEVDLVTWDREFETVLIRKWEEENAPTNPKHAMGLLGHMENASSEKLRAVCFETYSKIIKDLKLDRDAGVRTAMERVRIGLSETSETPTPPKTQTTDQDLDREKDQTRPREDLDLRESAQTPLRPPATLTGGGLAACGQGDPEQVPGLTPNRLPRPFTAAQQGATTRLLATTTMRRSVT